MKATLNLANDLAVLPVCMAFVESFSTLYFKEKSKINSILLSAEEAFCYTVENAYGPGEFGEIRIQAEFLDNVLTLIFHDLGLACLIPRP